eukprot:g1452.t1
MAAPSIAWLRIGDLRLRDNPALYWAAESGNRCAGLRVVPRRGADLCVPRTRLPSDSAAPLGPSMRIEGKSPEEIAAALKELPPDQLAKVWAADGEDGQP